MHKIIKTERAMSLSISTVAVMVVVLVTLVGVLYFFRGGLQDSGTDIDTLTDDTSAAADAPILDPEKILCNPKGGDYYECCDADGVLNCVGPYEYDYSGGSGTIDPYAECISACTSPKKCFCIRDDS